MAIGRLGRIAFVVSTLTALPVTSGCRWMPTRRVSPALSETPAAALAPKGESLPPLPTLLPVPAEEALAEPVSSSPAERPLSTPILDSVAERDHALKRAIASDAAVPVEVEVPKLDPPPAPPSAEPGPPLTSEPAKFTPTDASKIDPSVSRAANEAEVNEKTTKTTSRDAWASGLGRLKDFAQERSRAGGPSAEAWEARAKILECMTESGDAPIWETVASALGAPVANDPEPPVAPVEPAFEVADLRVCKKVVGFGRTEPLDPEAMRPGRVALVYCETDGLRFDPEDEGFRSRLSSTLALVPSGGGEPAYSLDLGVAEDHCRRRRRDFFAVYRLTIPAELPPGEYRLRVVQKDLIAGREATRELPITIRP